MLEYDERRTVQESKERTTIYVHPVLKDQDKKGQFPQINVNEGVKLRWVLDLVQLCDKAEEKVLIFSEYQDSLELIEIMACRKYRSKNWSKGCEVLRLDGSLSAEERSESIVSKFNTDPKTKMLCSSFKTCEGLSLVGASRVVILDVLWNPASTRQAIGRAFRLGQQKKVVVYRLVAADTYEERRVYTTATRKEWLSKILFEPITSPDGRNPKKIFWNPKNMLSDVTNNCSDTFLDWRLRIGVKKIYEQTF